MVHLHITELLSIVGDLVSKPPLTICLLCQIARFQHVISTLEDAVTDAPKATKFLGQIFARVILEDGISLTEVGGLLQERDGREEPAGHHALDDSLASEVLGSMLESIRVERGDNAVDEIRAKSNLQRPGVCV